MHDILLVEDSDDDAALTFRLFAAAGVKNSVTRARNGAETIAYLDEVETPSPVHRDPPSIVVLDLKLPDASGFDILARIYRRPAFANTLRIVLSQLGDPGKCQKSLHPRRPFFSQ